MPSNVGLYNQDTSMSSDQFEIMDNNAGGAIIDRPVVAGGGIYRFNCMSDSQGFGDLNIRNVQSTLGPFFVRSRRRPLQHVMQESSMKIRRLCVPAERNILFGWLLVCLVTLFLNNNALALEVREVRQLEGIQGANNKNPRLRLIRMNCNIGEKILGYRLEYPRGNVPNFGIDPRPPIRFDDLEYQGTTLILHHIGLFDPARGAFPLTFIFYCSK